MRARTVLKDRDTDEDGDVNVISAFDLFRCPRQALFEFVVFAKLNWSLSVLLIGSGRAAELVVAVSFAVAIGGWKWIFMYIHIHVYVCVCGGLHVFICCLLRFGLLTSLLAWAAVDVAIGNGKTGNRRLKHINTLELSNLILFIKLHT